MTGRITGTPPSTQTLRRNAKNTKSPEKRQADARRKEADRKPTTKREIEKRNVSVADSSSSEEMRRVKIKGVAQAATLDEIRSENPHLGKISDEDLINEIHQQFPQFRFQMRHALGAKPQDAKQWFCDPAPDATESSDSGSEVKAPRLPSDKPVIGKSSASVPRLRPGSYVRPQQKIIFTPDHETGSELDAIRFWNENAEHLTGEEFMEQFEDQFPDYHFVFKREVGDAEIEPKKWICERRPLYKNAKPLSSSVLKTRLTTYLSDHGFNIEGTTAEASAKTFQAAGLNDDLPPPSYSPQGPKKSHSQNFLKKINASYGDAGLRMAKSLIKLLPRDKSGEFSSHFDAVIENLIIDGLAPVFAHKSKLMKDKNLLLTSLIEKNSGYNSKLNTKYTQAKLFPQTIKGPTGNHSKPRSIIMDGLMAYLQAPNERIVAIDGMDVQLRNLARSLRFFDKNAIAIEKFFKLPLVARHWNNEYRRQTGEVGWPTGLFHLAHELSMAFNTNFNEIANSIEQYRQTEDIEQKKKLCLEAQQRAQAHLTAIDKQTKFIRYAIGCIPRHDMNIMPKELNDANAMLMTDLAENLGLLNTALNQTTGALAGALNFMELIASTPEAAFEEAVQLRTDVRDHPEEYPAL